MNNKNVFDLFKELQEDTAFSEKCQVEQQLYDLAVVLKEYRKSKDISQEELSMSSGLTRQMISKVETYASTPSLATIIKYLNGLNINLTEIISRELTKV